MKVTLDLQDWMKASSKGYYIALRLKRKPQIIRKLKRFNVRLSQLQDIAGARIILDKNTDIDEIVNYLETKIKEQDKIKIHKDTDYRVKGRDDSGYRARHIILIYNKHKIELQLRSKIQHRWAERIERTSVVYGFYLKELEGDSIVLNYFKELSNVFYELESNRHPNPLQKKKLNNLYSKAKEIIQNSDKNKIFDSHANDDVLKTLTEISHSKKNNNILNWILIFNWNTGNFVSWIKVDSNDPQTIIKLYSDNENNFSAQDNYEVVLIGASDVSTIKNTHSHYFGIESYDDIIDNIDESEKNIKQVQSISIEEQSILTVMYRKDVWKTKKIKISTLKNHMCANLENFDKSLDKLLKKKYILRNGPNDPVTLNLDKKIEIDQIVNM